MLSHSKKRKLGTQSPQPTSLSPESLKSITGTNTSLSNEEKMENIKKYINDSFEFLRDTSKIKTGRDRDNRENEILGKIEQTNEKILSKYPELNNNTKLMAMKRGRNTRTFGGKGKTYKNNKKNRKRRTIKRKLV